MNNENGFIVLHRKMLEWEWYSDPKTVTVWLYLLLKANWKPNRWRGIDIERGQTLETIAGIAKAVEEIYKYLDKEVAGLYALKEYFVNEVLQIPDVKINGYTGSLPFLTKKLFELP